MLRTDNRPPDELRTIQIQTGFSIYPEGSVLISFGNTKVLCNATVEHTVPGWLRDSGTPGGWITAEYALLPRSTQQRTRRETMGLGGRTQEIKRFIGRSLRAAFNLELLDGITCIVDCDVLQADGGTRTASVTGGYVALCQALKPLVESNTLPQGIFLPRTAAVSVGIVDGTVILDLNYEEDSAAQVDMNVVMNAENEFIEIQGTAEKATFSRKELDQMLSLAQSGCTKLFEYQDQALAR